ncbi:MAG: hypothetical protein LBH32_14700, partial [Dysgonamonadaceae bacterium]|nr:hypothetical protein [Dysgonamonadaceae bacterium]
LSEKFGKEKVFSIIAPVASIANNGHVFGKIRNGLFDYAFAANDNRPVAFDLYDSPFGNEPFDASELCFKANIGAFSDNFDGYIFLQPLYKENREKPLLKLYSEEYIDEIKRRATTLNAENETFWGITHKNLNRAELIEKLQQGTKDKKRFENIE